MQVNKESLSSFLNTFYYCIRYARLAQIQNSNPGIYDEFIYNHLVDATGVFIPREFHQLSSQHFCVDMNCDWYGHNYNLTVYKTLNL